MFKAFLDPIFFDPVDVCFAVCSHTLFKEDVVVAGPPSLHS